MAKRVAINGFGRIGRSFLRAAIDKSEIEVVVVNDLVEAPHLAYLLKYDSVHGRFKGSIEVEGKDLNVNGKKILVVAEKDPLRLPWKELNIDFVIEASGHFTDTKDASLHLKAGAKRVIITAPAKGDAPLFVMGVNHLKYNPKTDFVVSNASCTTNCLAPLVKVLLDNFGVEEGLMTTVHSLTASQPTQDGPSKKDWRGGRAAGVNIIPSSTGAAVAVTKCLPELKGKLTGMAFRVPTIDSSAVDLTVKLSKATTYQEICNAYQKASQEELKGILAYTDEEVVSSDFIGTEVSCTFDSKAGIMLNPTFVKLIGWYDNEWGYACRVRDLLIYMASKD